MMGVSVRPSATAAATASMGATQWTNSLQTEAIVTSVNFRIDSAEDLYPLSTKPLLRILTLAPSPPVSESPNVLVNPTAEGFSDNPIPSTSERIFVTHRSSATGRWESYEEIPLNPFGDTIQDAYKCSACGRELTDQDGRLRREQGLPVLLRRCPCILRLLRRMDRSVPAVHLLVFMSLMILCQMSFLVYIAVAFMN